MKPQMRFNLPHLDAAENFFFQRELEMILREQFDVKYAVLKGKQFVPVDNSIDPGAETVTWRQFDMVGQAKRIKDASDDLPMVNAKGVENNSPMVSYGAAFSYTLDELRAAAKVNRPLERSRAMAARKTVDQTTDAVIATGDSPAGIDGFISRDNQVSNAHPDVQVIATASGYTATGILTDPGTGTASMGVVQASANAGTPTAWAAKSQDEIIKDVTALISQVASTTKDVEHVHRILLPVAQYNYVASTPRSTISDTTILEFLKGAHPEVEFASWERLKGAGQLISAAASDRMIGYDPDPMNLRVLMSIEFEQLAPQLRNMSYIVNCRNKMGSVIVPYPLSIIYADGI